MKVMGQLNDMLREHLPMKMCRYLKYHRNCTAVQWNMQGNELINLNRLTEFSIQAVYYISVGANWNGAHKTVYWFLICFMTENWNCI